MVSTRSVMCSSESSFLISAKVASDIASSRTISRAPFRIAQARVQLALEADVAADAAEGARHVGRVDQELVQVGVALEHVAIFGCDLVGLEIGQAGHLFRSPLMSS